MCPMNEEETYRNQIQEISQKQQNDQSTILTADQISSIHAWIAQMGQHWLNHEKYQVSKQVLQFEYPSLDYGTNRNVYDLNNGTVLKVALSELGYKSNETEAQIYRSCNEDVKAHLCPIIESGHGWIIMKKMSRPVPQSLSYVWKLVELQMKFLMKGIIPIDLTIDNAALSENDDIVVVDYGLFISGLDSPHFKDLAQ
ncbi:hypothetical protein [Metabacillus sp. RGM 3146]|uniref:hypothetical protein n=1 Tax=Metabacillus sp. RGM 3146 TaxID=3401092 RepID=UPI003B9D8F6F